MKSAVRIFSTLLSSGVFLFACAPSDSTGGSGGQTPGSGGALGTGGASTGSGGAPSGSGGAGTGGAVTASGGATGSGGRVNASGGAIGSGGADSSGGADGTGGRGAGSGGRGAGSGGSTGTGGGAGTAGSSGTFAAVATILGNSCGTGNCHQGTAHTDLRNNAGLYTRIVGGMPMGTMVEDTCVGRTLVVASNPGTSVISQIIKLGGLSACGPRMPNMCSTTSNMPRPCLTAAQIATIDSWIAAGANP